MATQKANHRRRSQPSAHGGGAAEVAAAVDRPPLDGLPGRVAALEAEVQQLRSALSGLRVAVVEQIPRKGTPKDLAEVVERFRRRIAEAPLEVDWGTILAAEADRV